MNVKRFLCVLAMFACGLLVVPLIGDDDIAQQDAGDVRLKNGIVQRIEFNDPTTKLDRGHVVARNAKPSVIIEATIAEIDNYGLLGLTTEDSETDSSKDDSAGKLGKLEVAPIVRIVDEQVLRRLYTSLQKHSASGKASILSKPKVITQDGRLAKIMVGQHVKSDAGVSGKVANVGLTMTCTPQITKDDRVIVAIDLSKTEIADENKLASKNSDGLSEQRILTAVEVGAGESALLTMPRENGLIVFLSPAIIRPAPVKATTAPVTILPPRPNQVQLKRGLAAPGPIGNAIRPILRRAAGWKLPAACLLWFDQDIVFGERFGSL